MTTLTLLQSRMADFLTGQGIAALSAWPREDRQVQREPLAVVKVKEVEATAAGFQHYLGEAFDDTSQRWIETYGQKVKVQFALELYSPADTGEEGCRRLLDQVAVALQKAGPEGLSVESWTMGETAFQQASGMFHGRLQVVCRGLLTAETGTDGIFQGFEVKGEVQVWLQ